MALETISTRRAGRTLVISQATTFNIESPRAEDPISVKIDHGMILFGRIEFRTENTYIINWDISGPDDGLLYYLVKLQYSDMTYTYVVREDLTQPEDVIYTTTFIDYDLCKCLETEGHSISAIIYADIKAADPRGGASYPSGNSAMTAMLYLRVNQSADLTYGRLTKEYEAGQRERPHLVNLYLNIDSSETELITGPYST